MKSVILDQQWNFRPMDPQAVEELARKAGLPPLIAGFLYQRGLTSVEDMTQHMAPMLRSLSDPFQMLDMDKAVARLAVAVDRGEKIGVFGDYDADGVTSTALLTLFFRALGVETQTYIPHRETEGYGLNRDGILALAESGCRVLVTVDCGISNLEEVEFAKDHGLDVIVTDHHEPPPELPRALAVVNPKRPGCPFPFKELAGVGVAFNLARALRGSLYERGHWAQGTPPNLKDYLDLVALGTIADVVPLLGDNRILVRTGLEVLSEGRRAGLAALMEVCALRDGVTATDVAFRMAPRINAAGRIAHAGEALRLFLATDAHEARQLAEGLHLLNQERQAEEAVILKEAQEGIRALGDRSAYVLARQGWRRGVVGIVASKLAEQLGKPVILLAQEADLAVGSGRSPEGVNLFEALSKCSRFLSAFGGHQAAAGLTLPAEALEGFEEAFEQAVAEALLEGRFVRALQLDASASLSDFADPAFPEFLEILEPFGSGYEPPLVSLRDFAVHRSQVVGKGHLKLTLMPQSAAPLAGAGAPMELVGWGHGEKIDLAWEDLEIACQPTVRHWQGRRRVELRLKDARHRFPG